MDLKIADVQVDTKIVDVLVDTKVADVQVEIKIADVEVDRKGSPNFYEMMSSDVIIDQFPEAEGLEECTFPWETDPFSLSLQSLARLSL